MTKSEINAYANRVTSASKTELIVIMFEIAKNYIETALKESEQGNMELYKHNLRKAKQFVSELNSSLDMKYKMSYDLMSLYMYMNRTLVTAILTYDTSKLPSVLNMLEMLRQAFEQVSKQDDSGPVMKNVQTVYAGLTYSGTSLNEMYDSQANRGYTV